MNHFDVLVSRGYGQTANAGKLRHGHGATHIGRIIFHEDCGKVSFGDWLAANLFAFCPGVGYPTSGEDILSCEIAKFNNVFLCNKRPNYWTE